MSYYCEEQLYKEQTSAPIIVRTICSFFRFEPMLNLWGSAERAKKKGKRAA